MHTEWGTGEIEPNRMFIYPLRGYVRCKQSIIVKHVIIGMSKGFLKKVQAEVNDNWQWVKEEE